VTATHTTAATTKVPTQGRNLAVAAGRPTLLGRIGAWWKAWRERRATLAAFDLWAPAELTRLAADAGVPGSELRVLAGKWPDSADLLMPRLATARLDVATVERDAPGVLRDLERVCAECDRKDLCKRDLASGAVQSGWRDYCPNVTTLDALHGEPCSSASNQPKPN
jgi:hypothetical protein